MTTKDINNAKADLLKEIKNLCQEIQKTHSFSGLVSLESRINKLYQNFIVLKYLDQQSILTELSIEEEKNKESLLNMNQPILIESNQHDLPKLTLNLNDKIAFKNQLFNKDEKLFEKAIVQLNSSKSLLETKPILDFYATQFEWHLKEEFAQRFEDLVEKRFV
ncbi:MAG: hypothetical protein ACK5MD_03395 [Flavobacteriales bacterium]